MPITLGTHVLPDGLIWEDELDWEPVVQSTDYSVTGSLIIEEAERQAGRPITLRGGRTWAWMTRSALLALSTTLQTPGISLTLTLHDARIFTVTARREANAGPVTAEPVPAVMDSGPADPGTGTKYWIDAIRLMVI